MTPTEKLETCERNTEAAKTEFQNLTSKMLSILNKNPNISQNELQVKLNELHSAAVKYFTCFSKELKVYTQLSNKYNNYEVTEKVDDAIIVARTILKHWRSLKSYQNRHQGIVVPNPSERAYSSIQAYINTYDRKAARILEKDFSERSLPVHGFRKSRKLKKRIRSIRLFGYEIPLPLLYPIFIGLILLIIYKLIQFYPSLIDEVAIILTGIILTIFLHPKRRFLKVFLSCFTLISSSVALPMIDFSAAIEKADKHSLERIMLKVASTEPTWPFYLTVGAISLLALYLDQRERQT